MGASTYSTNAGYPRPPYAVGPGTRIEAARGQNGGSGGDPPADWLGDVYPGSWLWIQRSSAGPLSTLTMTAYRVLFPV